MTRRRLNSVQTPRTTRPHSGTASNPRNDASPETKTSRRVIASARTRTFAFFHHSLFYKFPKKMCHRCVIVLRVGSGERGRIRPIRSPKPRSMSAWTVEPCQARGMATDGDTVKASPVRRAEVGEGFRPAHDRLWPKLEVGGPGLIPRPVDQAVRMRLLGVDEGFPKMFGLHLCTPQPA